MCHRRFADGEFIRVREDVFVSSVFAFQLSETKMSQLLPKVGYHVELQQLDCIVFLFLLYGKFPSLDIAQIPQRGEKTATAVIASPLPARLSLPGVKSLKTVQTVSKMNIRVFALSPQRRWNWERRHRRG
jgi:hypothetical protein